MTYQDQRSDDHPEAVLSDPVPVQRTAPDDENLDHDADRDGVDDRTEADAGYHDNADPERGYHDSAEPDSAEPERGFHDSAEPESGQHDNAVLVAGPHDEGHHEGNAPGEGFHENADEPVDADRDGVDDRVTDTEVRDETDVYQEAEDDRTGYDDPVVASPVDTDAERTGVDDEDLDRAHDDRAHDHAPTFPDSALAPAAFGAAAAGGVAGAAAMAASRTDTRTDVDAVDRRLEDDRLADDDRDRFTDVTDRVADEPADDDDERPAHDEPEAQEQTEQTQTELMPGEVEAAPVTALVAVEAAQGFRDRWREVQLRFVDDPRGATAEAQGLAEEVADALVDALNAMRSDLGNWGATDGADTEHLRVVVRRYRDFLDRMLQS
ncbi:hypothetical protein [Asanoa siamensis]|uniref:Uncharacterized protein n=1 Tax=Asanoa siamensis TaxID=926357 RepID=A0ABQ4CHS0_9ACTN|nr:hypothetical protein [Asanoa siamensis]GIF70820.1 hypothetical protein Asi02nite_03380 [Asanoa siamensis]